MQIIIFMWCNYFLFYFQGFMPPVMDAIKFQISMNAFVGNWPKKYPSKLYLFKTYTFRVLSITFIMNVFLEVFSLFSDFNNLIDQLCMLIEPLSYLLKLAIFVQRKSLIFKLCNLMEDPIFQDYPIKFHVFMKKTIYKSKVVARCYYVSALFVVFLYCVRPLFSHNINVPIPFAYTFGFSNSIVYIYQAIALTIIVTSNTAIDLLVTSIMGVASCQFQILNDKILYFEEWLNLSTKEKSYIKLYGVNNKNTENKILYGIKRWVLHHRAILRLVSLFSIVSN